MGGLEPEIWQLFCSEHLSLLNKLTNRDWTYFYFDFQFLICFNDLIQLTMFLFEKIVPMGKWTRQEAELTQTYKPYLGFVGLS